MRITKLTFALLTLIGLVFVASYLGGQSSNAASAPDGRVNAHWKGASTLTPVGAGPNPARCGAFPENVELTFSGGGIDTGGGVFTSAASACTNTTTGLITDLKATDTFQNGDSIFIESDPLTPIPNPDTCVSTNAHAVGFRVGAGGGTGTFAGATGHGRYHIALNDTACNGQPPTAHIWFEGILQLAQ